MAKNLNGKKITVAPYCMGLYWENCQVCRHCRIGEPFPPGCLIPDWTAWDEAAASIVDLPRDTAPVPAANFLTVEGSEQPGLTWITTTTDTCDTCSEVERLERQLASQREHYETRVKNQREELRKLHEGKAWHAAEIGKRDARIRELERANNDLLDKLHRRMGKPSEIEELQGRILELQETNRNNMLCADMETKELRIELAKRDAHIAALDEMVGACQGAAESEVPEATIKEIHSRIDSVVRVMHERIEGFNDKLHWIGADDQAVAELKIELGNMTAQLKEQHERIAALESARDTSTGARHDDPAKYRGVLKDEDWPEVVVSELLDYGENDEEFSRGWMIYGGGGRVGLTRAQAEAVVRAYRWMVRRCQGNVAESLQWEEARRILKGEGR